MTGIIAKMTGVWTELMGWITQSFPKVIELFYIEGDLTLLGVLAVASLGISVFFLLMGIIQRFLHFGG